MVQEQQILRSGIRVGWIFSIDRNTKYVGFYLFILFYLFCIIFVLFIRFRFAVL